MMKTLVAIIGCAMALGLQPARAADLPPAYEGAPSLLVPGVPFNWTGFYVGANVGYMWSTNNSNAVGPGVSGVGSETASSVNGGAQMGFNWQINRWMYGIESDIQATSLSGSLTYAGISQTDSSRWFGTTRARLGFAADHLLFYGTAGAGYTELAHTLTGAVTAAVTRITVGWTAGAGIEAALTANWSVKAEYLYLDLSAVDNTIGKVTLSTRPLDNVVRFGVNYKYGGL